MKIDVAFGPQELAGRKLCGSVCVVLDIFRATTSMITAFQHGCRAIVPVNTVDEAWAVAAGQFPRTCLLAGERKGLRIAGFHLGNSPQEFMGKHVANQLIVMTTTNGTAAVRAAEDADITLIGAFLNASAVCRQTKHYGDDILIVCAGTDGRFSLEDALCAGLLVDMLRKDCRQADLTDAARAGLLMYARAADALSETAAKGSHGRYLGTIGFAEDVKACMCIDSVEVVPAYRQGKITVT